MQKLDISSSRYIQYVWDHAGHKSLSNKNARMYIGWLWWSWKLYSHQFLDAITHLLFEKIKEWEVAEIYYGWRVGQFLNQTNASINGIGILKNKIWETKKFYSKEKNIQIVSWDTVVWHKRLYSYLQDHHEQEESVEELFEDREVWELKDSLYYCKEIAYAAKNDEALWGEIWNAVPKWMRDKVHPEYYAIAEIWLRLYDLIDWITIQWWATRQKVYDTVINDIVEGKYNSLNHLKIPDEVVLSWCYIDTSKLKKNATHLNLVLKHKKKLFEVLKEKEAENFLQIFLLMIVLLVWGLIAWDLEKSKTNFVDSIKNNNFVVWIENDTLQKRYREVWWSIWTVDVTKYRDIEILDSNYRYVVEENWNQKTLYLRDENGEFTTKAGEELIEMLSCIKWI